VQCNGAGDGNRTRTSSLEGYSSTIELLPPGGVAVSFEADSLIKKLVIKLWWREVDYSGHPALRPSGAILLSRMFGIAPAIPSNQHSFSVVLVHL
jgi:hypothetical protein